MRNSFIYITNYVIKIDEMADDMGCHVMCHMCWYPKVDIQVGARSVIV